MDAIVIERVSKAFCTRSALLPWRRPRDRTLALSDFSLHIPGGQVQVLIGPNGSGKTTLLKLIATMLLPDSGRVLITGMDTRREGAAVREKVGFAVASERSFYPRLTACENLDFFAALDNIPRSARKHCISQLLNTTGLADQSDQLVMTFSSGMYQRLGIARALLKNPPIVLLDEPSRSLDPGSAVRLRHLIRELSYRGTTVILATHSFDEAVAVGDQVAVLCRGKLAGKIGVEADLTAARLREFYFDLTGESAHESELAFECYEQDRILTR